MHPFDHGYNAEYLGIPVTANPYPIDTQPHDDWESGWVAGYEATQDELPF